jgi:hypothetical protein
LLIDTVTWPERAAAGAAGVVCEWVCEWAAGVVCEADADALGDVVEGWPPLDPQAATSTVVPTVSAPPRHLRRIAVRLLIPGVTDGAPLRIRVIRPRTVAVDGGVTGSNPRTDTTKEIR